MALDSLAAIGLGVGGLAALGSDEGVGAVALVGAALFTAAALHGSGNADKCRAAIADYGLEMSASQPTMEVRRTPKQRRPDPEPAPKPESEPEPDEKEEEPVTRPKVQLPKPAPPVERPDHAEPGTHPEPAARDWSQFWREVP